MCLAYVGEQRKRDYDWSRANKDPRTTRFGYVDRKGQQTSMKQVWRQTTPSRVLAQTQQYSVCL